MTVYRSVFSFLGLVSILEEAKELEMEVLTVSETLSQNPVFMLALSFLEKLIQDLRTKKLQAKPKTPEIETKNAKKEYLKVSTKRASVKSIF